MKTALLSSVAALFLLAGCDNNGTNNNTGAPGTTDTTKEKPVAPDNTGRNTRDSDSSTAPPTPIDQSNESRDIDITAEIRRAVVDDSAMSTNAKNVKIVTQDGVVTLRGVVDSQAEKDAIEAKAKAVAGVTSVDNQLEVNTP